jgi:hypothetical protein
VTPVSYALSTTNGPSGVFDVGSGLQVQLKTVSGVVHGYINQAAQTSTSYTVSVSGAGIVTLTQQRAIKHTDVPPASDNSDDPTNLVGTNLIKLTGNSHRQGRRHGLGRLRSSPERLQFKRRTAVDHGRVGHPCLAGHRRRIASGATVRPAHRSPPASP